MVRRVRAGAGRLIRATGRADESLSFAFVRERDSPALGPRPGSRLRVHFHGVEDPTLLDQNIPVWLSNIRIAALSL